MLINFKRLVMERKRFPEKIPNPRCEPHEVDTTLQDWFKNELEKSLASNSYAFVEMLDNFTDIDPGFLFRVRNKMNFMSLMHLSVFVCRFRLTD